MSTTNICLNIQTDYVPSSFAIILMGKRELVALFSLSSLCLVIVVWLFLMAPWVCRQFVIVVFPDHTHLLFFALSYWRTSSKIKYNKLQGYISLAPCSTHMSAYYSLSRNRKSTFKVN